MSPRRRREVEAAGLSFLDCICCGFGAVILLLVIVKVHDPIFTEEQRGELISLIARLKAQIIDIEQDTAFFQSELVEARSETERLESDGKNLAARLAQLRGSVDETRGEADVIAALEAAAKRAEQELTTEAERLRKYQRTAQENTVGGIPADSEYIIFVIDTSGSMQNYSWPKVVQKVAETLDVYPKVKGIQVLNDMGNYMFNQYAGRWIPDSPNRRRIILKQLLSWRAFSNSSPVEGIEKAIRTFHSWDKLISIYVFGDEFTGESAQTVIDRVAQLNRPDARGRRMVRVHAVGFSIDTNDAGFQRTSRRFASLMRRLCLENGGTFVGL
ncbi:MAG: VWA domain-containing protein [Myxococcota bacterium]